MILTKREAPPRHSLAEGLYGWWAGAPSIWCFPPNKDVTNLIPAQGRHDGVSAREAALSCNPGRAVYVVYLLARGILELRSGEEGGGEGGGEGGRKGERRSTFRSVLRRWELYEKFRINNERDYVLCYPYPPHERYVTPTVDLYSPLPLERFTVTRQE